MSAPSNDSPSPAEQAMLDTARNLQQQMLDRINQINQQNKDTMDRMFAQNEQALSRFASMMGQPPAAPAQATPVNAPDHSEIALIIKILRNPDLKKKVLALAAEVPDPVPPPGASPSGSSNPSSPVGATT